MSLVHEGQLHYPKFHALPGELEAHCNWKLWQLEDGSYVSLAVESSSNRGPSVTNAAEAVVKQAWLAIFARAKQAAGWNPHIRYFEAYPYYFTGKERRVDEVIATWRDGEVRRVSWKPMPLVEFEALVGTKLA